MPGNAERTVPLRARLILSKISGILWNTENEIN